MRIQSITHSEARERFAQGLKVCTIEPNEDQFGNEVFIPTCTLEVLNEVIAGNGLFGKPVIEPSDIEHVDNAVGLLHTQDLAYLVYLSGDISEFIEHINELEDGNSVIAEVYKA